MEVLLEGESATVAMEQQVVEVIEDFAGWTGREGVCVPSIAIVDPGTIPASDGVTGMYYGRGLPIHVVAGAGIATTTRHELVHALDAEEGISEAHLDLFPPRGWGYEDGLSGVAVAREALAHVASQRPSELALQRLVLPSCGDDTGSQAVFLVLDTIYPFAPLDHAVQGRGSLTLERLLSFPAADREWVATGASEGRALIALVAASELRVQRVDPESEATETVVAGAGDPESSYALATGEGHVLALDTEVGCTATVVDFEAGVTNGPSAVGVPATLAVEAAGVSLGSMWLAGSEGGELALYRVSLDDFRAEAAPIPSDTAIGRVADPWGPLARGISPVGTQTIGVVTLDGIATYTPGTATWDWTPAPVSELYGGAQSATGQLVAVAEAPLLDPERASVPVLLALDEPGGTWVVAADPCGSTASVGIPAIAADESGAWLWDYGTEQGDYDTRFFSAVTVE